MTSRTNLPDGQGHRFVILLTQNSEEKDRYFTTDRVTLTFNVIEVICVRYAAVYVTSAGLHVRLFVACRSSSTLSRLIIQYITLHNYYRRPQLP